jgi:peptidoglycan/xylan/chitin deacetylase (PgdA/CDA1 family)
MDEVILNFHGVGEPPPCINPAEQHYWLGEAAFYKLLDSISACRSEGKLGIGITFDDGNSSDLRISLPALVKRGLTARFFVCAGRIGRPYYLDAAALADLIAAGMVIGSHGMNHVDWRRTDANELEEEISGARRRLEDVCGLAIDDVAIPFGSYGSRELSALKTERFKRVYTSDRGLTRADSWLRPRNSVDASWHSTDISRCLSQSRAPSFRLKRNLTVIYKSMRWRSGGPC